MSTLKPKGKISRRNNKKCQARNCQMQATYAPEGSHIATRCSLHSKKSSDVFVFSKVCEVIGCSDEACYGPRNTKKRLRCVIYGKQVNYVKIFIQKCIFDNCLITANYSAPGSTSRRYCRKHSLLLEKEYPFSKKKYLPKEDEEREITLNLSNPSEINKLDESTFEIEELFDVPPQKTCVFGPCPEIALYGFANISGEVIPEYCDFHKILGSVLIN